jgi:ferritin-like metal-binding protein YciE
MSKLYDCFLTELAGIYDVEKQMSKALPKLAEAAKHEELKSAFKSHRAETEEHASRLERVFAILGEKIPNRNSKAMRSLVTESQESIEEELGDAGLICAAQRIEHYEIATYGCLRSWAQFLDQDEAANLLEETLEEENAADELLTSLAVELINLDAGELGGEEESEEDGEREHAAKGEKSADD